jgi:hypothetical protein
MRTNSTINAASPQKLFFKPLPFFTLLIYTISSLFFSTAAFGQDGNCATNNCVSGDIQVKEVKLVQKTGPGTYADLPKSCNSANQVFNVSLKVTFDVTSQTRYGFLITGDIYFNGTVKKGSIAQCDPGTFTQGLHTIYVDKYLNGTQITWTCGEKIELKSTYTAWNNAATSKSNPSICTYYNPTTGAVTANNCKTIAPKCRYYGPNESFLIIAPLSAILDMPDPVCGTNNEAYRTYTFNGSASGGFLNPGGSYTYKWYINGNLQSNTTTTLTYTPTTGDPFTIKFEAYDQATPTPTKSTAERTITTPATCCVPSTGTVSANKDINNTCPGTKVTLSASGGTKGTNAKYVWYTGGCGIENSGTKAGEGESIEVSPTITTTYYVRLEGDCGKTACASVKVDVKTASTAPTTTSVTGDKYCSGDDSKATIKVTNGSLGTGAKWVWYTGGCGIENSGTKAGEGESIEVSPTITTTYYVRAEGEGDCATTTCATAVVAVYQYLPKPVATPTDPTCKTAGQVEITEATYDATVTYKLMNSDHTYTAVNGLFSSVASGSYTLTASKTGYCSTNGDNVEVKDAPTAPDKPVVGVKTEASCSSSSIVLEVKSPLGTDFEYSNNGGDWQTDVLFTIKAGAGYSIKARRIKPNTDCESDVATCAGEQAKIIGSLGSTRERTYDVEVNLDPQTRATAAPNPFNDRIRFSVKSSVSGQGALELYNMLGQKVKTVYQGYVTAGQTNSIEYFVPSTQRANLIYVFRVGNQQTSGKLVNVKQ